MNTLADHAEVLDYIPALDVTYLLVGLVCDVSVVISGITCGTVVR